MPAPSPRSAERDEAATQAALRAFELVLLREIGLLPDLGTETASRRPVRADGATCVLADAGVVDDRRARTRRPSAAPRSAAVEMALARATSTSLQRVAAGALAELRPLLARPASLSSRHFDSLRTRQVMIEAQALTPAST